MCVDPCAPRPVASAPGAPILPRGRREVCVAGPRGMGPVPLGRGWQAGYVGPPQGRCGRGGRL
eukprot:4992431-Prymnesium_polylepis.1